MIPAEIPRDGLIHGYKSVFDSLQLVCTINSIHCYSSFGHWCMLFPEFEGVTLYDSRRHDTDSVQFGEVRCNTDDICTRRHLDNIVFLYENLRPPLGTSALNRLDHLSANGVALLSDAVPLFFRIYSESNRGLIAGGMPRRAPGISYWR